MANGIKLRRDLQADLASTIAEGELVFATDTNKLGFKSGSTEYFVDLSKINTIAGLEEAITAITPKTDPNWLNVTFYTDKAKVVAFMQANGGLLPQFGVKFATISSIAANYLSENMSNTFLPIKNNSCYFLASYTDSYGNPAVISVDRENYTEVQIDNPDGYGTNYSFSGNSAGPEMNILDFKATNVDPGSVLANTAYFKIRLRNDPDMLDNLILSFDVSIYNPEIDDGYGNVFKIFTPITPALVYI